MPQRSRSRRAAARQTQLGQRKKRTTRGPSGIPAEVPAAPAETSGDGSPVDERRMETPTTQAAVGQRPASVRQQEPRPTVYNYVRPEVTRIVLLSTTMLVVLIVLSFVLR